MESRRVLFRSLFLPSWDSAWFSGRGISGWPGEGEPLRDSRAPPTLAATLLPQVDEWFTPFPPGRPLCHSALSTSTPCGDAHVGATDLCAGFPDARLASIEGYRPHWPACARLGASRAGRE